MLQLIYFRLQAARILVAKGGVCKLSGFGFIQEITERNEFQQVSFFNNVFLYIFQHFVGMGGFVSILEILKEISFIFSVSLFFLFAN